MWGCLALLSRAIVPTEVLTLQRQLGNYLLGAGESYSLTAQHNHKTWVYRCTAKNITVVWTNIWTFKCTDKNMNVLTDIWTYVQTYKWMFRQKTDIASLHIPSQKIKGHLCLYLNVGSFPYLQATSTPKVTGNIIREPPYWTGNEPTPDINMRHWAGHKKYKKNYKYSYLWWTCWTCTMLFT